MRDAFAGLPVFQSPRGDFGFLKIRITASGGATFRSVSIPSRGFWFFEVTRTGSSSVILRFTVSIPSRGFWFFEASITVDVERERDFTFQSPRGDFGFLK